MDSTEDRSQILEAQDKRLCTEFKAQKFMKESKKHWDLFYKRNETRFFKDRHWTTREFQELTAKKEVESEDAGRKVLLEVGCGVGNFLYPLLEEDQHLFVHACDLSPRAVEFVKQNPNYSEDKVHAFQCDITDNDCFKDHVQENSVDIASLIFVLSALNPSVIEKAIDNVSRTLTTGGLLIFRDYAVNDMAMFRFAPRTKISDRLYLRQDGTTSYFFTKEELSDMFSKCNLTVDEIEYVERRTVNKKEGVDVQRIFVQAKCRKVN